MINVSERWKENDSMLLRKGAKVLVRFALTDPVAQSLAFLESNDSLYYSASAQSLNNPIPISPVDYASFEKNYWLTDGTFHLPPNNEVANKEAWISGYDALSDDDGYFSVYPTITATWSALNDISIRGVTITFRESINEYATEVYIAVYSGATVITEKLFTNNKVVLVCPVDIVNYDKIVIQIRKWSKPKRRARITHIDWGSLYTWGNKEITKLSYESSVDLISNSIANNSISFTINNIAQEYNPLNPDGAYKYLMERQRINSYYGYEYSDGTSEMIPGGVYFLTSWETPGNSIEATFSGKDILSSLDFEYYKGTYNAEGSTLYDVAQDIINSFPFYLKIGLTYFIDESLKDVKTTAPIPVMKVYDCFKMLAHASGCIVYVNRDGGIDIRKEQKTEYSNEVSRLVSYAEPKTSQLKSLHQIEVSVYNYTVKEDYSEIYRNVLIINGETTLNIRHSNSSAYVYASVTNGTLISANYYSYASDLVISGNGEVEVVIFGRSIESSTSVYRRNFSSTGDSVKISNPLIDNKESAEIVLSWLSTQLRRRTQYDVEYRGRVEYDTCDVVSLQTRYQDANVTITKNKMTFNGGWKGTLTGRGV